MKPACIFYDLETTDKDPIGQIINLCFIVTDSEFNIIDEFSRDIKIGRLQLPRAGAILANKTDVLEHQSKEPASEMEVLSELWGFIHDVISKNKNVTIIGFNNLGFDQFYLRTSFIRNGLNPYFQNNVREADLFLLLQKLSSTRADFPRVKSEKPRKRSGEKISLSLETITKAFGILEGKQTHQSRDDVIITIELAKILRDKFDASILSFNPYEAGQIHAGANKKENRGIAYYKTDTQYDLTNPELSTRKPYLFLDATHKYSIWIDLESFKKGHKALRLSKVDLSAFFTDSVPIEDNEILELSKEAIKKYSKVTMANYFTATECDIEQFIYRIDFDNITALNSVIWQNEEAKMIDDAKRVLGRFRLANYKLNGKQDEKFTKTLKDYALYRYGGKLRFDKGADQEDKILERTVKNYFHPTWNKLVAEIDSRSAESTDGKDKNLLQSLKKFYFESEIYKVAGPELEKIEDAPDSEVAAEETTQNMNA